MAKVVKGAGINRNNSSSAKQSPCRGVIAKEVAQGHVGKLDKVTFKKR